MSVDSQSGARRAALLLHAMQRIDRDWVLAALPERRREQMMALLGELGSLGIPADAEILRQVTEAAGGETFTPLAADEIAALAALLQDEPPQVAAWLLAGASTPWGERLAPAFAPQFAVEVDAVRRLPAPSAAIEATGKLVAEHLRARGGTTPPANSRRHWSHAWLQRWQR